MTATDRRCEGYASQVCLSSYNCYQVQLCVASLEAASVAQRPKRRRHEVS